MWRVGSKVPINVYEDDRPVCQCQTAADAARIVQAMNAAEESDPQDEGLIAAMFGRDPVIARLAKQIYDRRHASDPPVKEPAHCDLCFEGCPKCQPGRFSPEQVELWNGLPARHRGPAR